MISVLILANDEELNIAACLNSLPWRDDVHLLDSGSDDRTMEIASAMGAHITHHDFINFADQRNFGFSLPFRHEWIVMLDADERMTAELAAEIEQRIAVAGAEDAMFRVRRHDIFMGRWLRRSSGYPTWLARVFRRGHVKVERAVNETYVSDGRALQLSGHIEHFPFNKGMEWWLERHNQYSTGEAELVIAHSATAGLRWPDLFAQDPIVRRAALKRLAYRLPARPFLMFLYLYIVRLGFLDGAAGFQFASLRMAYEVMIDAKVACQRSSGAEAKIAGTSRSTPIRPRYRTSASGQFSE